MTQREVIEVHDWTTSATATTGFEPVATVIDPDAWLLFEAVGGEED